MLIPLIVLAIGATFFGYFGYDYFVGADHVANSGRVLSWCCRQYNSLAARGERPGGHSLSAVGFRARSASLWPISSILSITRLPARLAAQFRAAYLFLLNKWYFDELYDWVFVRTAFALGDGLWKSGDGAIIDGLGPNGVAALTRDLARQASRLQTGYVYHYAFVMMIGLVALVTWYLLPH